MFYSCLMIYLNNSAGLDIVNHPVHFVTNNGNMSPSAFIPFCGFGGNMSAMGIKIDEFDDPVCNSFQAKILNDQLCYEVDLNKYSNKDNIDKELSSGFLFFLDYNEDRQVTFEFEQSNKNLMDRIVQSENNMHASINFDTIGKLCGYIQNIHFSIKE